MNIQKTTNLYESIFLSSSKVPGNRYEENENTIIEKFGEAKPLVAREVASLLVHGGTDNESWQPIKDLALNIAALLKKERTEENSF